MAASLGARFVGAGFRWAADRDAAARDREVLNEQLRRFRAQTAQVMGHAQSRAAASGFAYESEGLQGYLRGLSDEFERQAAFMQRAGTKRLQAGSRASAFGLVGDVGSALTEYGQANNWWQG